VTAADAPRLTVMEPGAGRVGDLGSIGVQFKLWGEDTNGEVSVVEHPFPVGALVPPHLHTREDEYSIVTEGEIGFRSGFRQVVLAAGGYITKPRGEMHEVLVRLGRTLRARDPVQFDRHKWLRRAVVGVEVRLDRGLQCVRRL